MGKGDGRGSGGVSFFAVCVVNSKGRVAAFRLEYFFLGWRCFFFGGAAFFLCVYVFLMGCVVFWVVRVALTVPLYYLSQLAVFSLGVCCSFRGEGSAFAGYVVFFEGGALNWWTRYV